jgi:flagellar FliJ protein
MQLRSFQAEPILDLELIQWTLNYLDGLRAKIDQQAEILAEAQARVEAKRQQLIKATQERKVLEKLREKFLAELAEEERLTETRTNDEIGTALHHLALREKGIDEELAAS